MTMILMVSDLVVTEEMKVVLSRIYLSQGKPFCPFVLA